MSLCIANGLRPLDVFPFATYEEKTAAQIMNDLRISESIITYVCPYYIECLNTDSFPLILHPELQIQEQVDTYKPPKYYLKAIPISQNGQYWFYVEVQTQLKAPMDPIAVPVSTSEISKLTVEDILLAFKARFGYDFYDEKISMDGQVLSLQDPAAPVIAKTKTCRLQISLTISEQGRKKILGREHIAHEIVATEESYVNSLKMLDEYWQPAFRKTKIFDETEIHKLFREIKGILQVHDSFLTELKTVQIGFACELSYIFLKHLQNFTKAMVFVSAYKALDDMVKAKRANKTIEKQFKEIEDKCPDNFGRTFSSFYITPVQRYPRYPLLFRELDKFTPSFHPEKEFIAYTAQQLIAVNKHVDSISHRVLSLQKMEEIQNAMPPKYLIIEHGRELIEEVDIRIVSKKSGPGQLLLFNDIVLLCYQKKKQLTPIINCDILNFQFANGKPTIYSIYIVWEGESYQVDFTDLNDKQNWLDQYHSAIAEKYKTINLTQPFITWTDVDMAQCITERMSHDGCVVAGSAFFFGGSNASFISTSSLFWYVISEQTWASEETPVPAREAHTITPLRGNLYVAFGYSKKTGRVFHDIWCYNIASKTWSKIKPVNEKPLARYGHTCVAYDKKLYFYGGKICKRKGASDAYCTDLISVYDPETNEYHELAHPAVFPHPRYGHTATLLGRKHARMVIVGGKSADEFYGDCWLWDFKQAKWSIRVKAAVDYRFDHKACLIGRWLFIKGGLRDPTGTENVIIDTKQWTIVDDVEHLGNVPPNLCRHTLLCIDSHKALVFGGTDRTEHREYSTAWIADFGGDSHNFKIDNSKAIDRYWHNTSIDWFTNAAASEEKEIKLPSEGSQTFFLKEDTGLPMFINQETAKKNQKAYDGDDLKESVNYEEVRAKRRKRDDDDYESGHSKKLSAPRVLESMMESRRSKEYPNTPVFQPQSIPPKQTTITTTTPPPSQSSSKPVLKAVKSYAQFNFNDTNASIFQTSQPTLQQSPLHQQAPQHLTPPRQTVQQQQTLQQQYSLYQTQPYAQGYATNRFSYQATAPPSPSHIISYQSAPQAPAPRQNGGSDLPHFPFSSTNGAAQQIIETNNQQQQQAQQQQQQNYASTNPYSSNHFASNYASNHSSNYSSNYSGNYSTIGQYSTQNATYQYSQYSNYSTQYQAYQTTSSYAHNNAAPPSNSYVSLPYVTSHIPQQPIQPPYLQSSHLTPPYFPNQGSSSSSSLGSSPVNDSAFPTPNPADYATGSLYQTSMQPTIRTLPRQEPPAVRNMKQPGFQRHSVSVLETEAIQAMQVQNASKLANAGNRPMAPETNYGYQMDPRMGMQYKDNKQQSYMMQTSSAHHPERFIPPSASFSMSELCEILNINVNMLSPLEENAIKKHCIELWDIAYQNVLYEQRIIKMMAMITGSGVPSGISMRMKIFEYNSRSARVAKITSDITCPELIQKVRDYLKHEVRVIAIETARGVQQNLDERSLLCALNYVYFKDNGCLIVNVM